MNVYLLLLKTQCVCFLLLKVSLLLKYFIFTKYRTSEWKAQHLIYFPSNEILYSRSLVCARAKHIQNQLSTSILNMVILVVLIRFALMLVR